MIDLNELRSDPERYRDACRKKRVSFDVDQFLALDQQVKDLRIALEELRARQNAVSKEMPKLQGEDKTKKLSEMKELSDRLKQRDLEFRALEGTWIEQQRLIPSVPHVDVPIGKDDSDNKEVKKWGEPRQFEFPLRSHAELGERLDILDIERGVKVAGSRNYFLKGEGARLQHALISFACDFIHNRGYTLMDPPHIVRYEAMMGTGYFPGGEESAYHLDERDKDFYLIGTSEVSVASYHMDEIVPESSFPIKYAGYSPCYRREAGTYGKDTQGIYRVHQFYKVEQVIICEEDAEVSMKYHQELLKNAEDVIQALHIPYRVVICSTGDMGQGQVFKNDVECWMPSRNAYGETHSCSTFHSFQARRLNLRYKSSKDGKNHFCHTLNNTLMASTRFLIPILENNQQKDGSVVVPEVLRKYMGGLEVIEPKK